MRFSIDHIRRPESRWNNASQGKVKVTFTFLTVSLSGFLLVGHISSSVLIEGLFSAIGNTLCLNSTWVLHTPLFYARDKISSLTIPKQIGWMDNLSIAIWCRSAISLSCSDIPDSIWYAIFLETKMRASLSSFLSFSRQNWELTVLRPF